MGFRISGVRCRVWGVGCGVETDLAMRSKMQCRICVASSEIRFIPGLIRFGSARRESEDATGSPPLPPESHKRNGTKKAETRLPLSLVGH